MPFRIRMGVGAGLGLCLLTAAGCSWIFVQVPPSVPPPPGLPPTCTSSVVAPVADTAGAALFGVSGAITAFTGLGITKDCEPWCSAEKGVLIATGVVELGVATALAFSAGHGYSATAGCRDLKAAQLSCVGGVEGACRVLRDRKSN